VKKPLPYEIIATLLALFGVFLLIGVYMPVINPGLTRIETHQELPSVGYYIVLTPIPLSVLLASWYFNRKAQQLKGDKKKPEEKHKKLKWILFGIVVFYCVIRFFVVRQILMPSKPSGCLNRQKLFHAEGVA